MSERYWNSRYIQFPWYNLCGLRAYILEIPCYATHGIALYITVWCNWWSIVYWFICQYRQQDEYKSYCLFGSHNYFTNQFWCLGQYADMCNNGNQTGRTNRYIQIAFILPYIAIQQSLIYPTASYYRAWLVQFCFTGGAGFLLFQLDKQLHH